MARQNTDLLNYIHIPSVDTVQSETGKAAIDQLFELIRARNLTDLVLYFHGGLTDRETADKSRQLMTDRFGQGANRHAISPIWETSGGETIQSIISQQLDLPIVKRMIGRVRARADARHAQAQKSKSLAKGDTIEPWIEPLTDEELEQLEKELARDYAAEFSNDVAFQKDVYTAAEETLAQHSKSISPDLAQELETIQAKAKGGAESKGWFDPGGDFLALARITTQVIQRERSGRGHGPSATVIEEIVREYSDGAVKALWDDMKRRAEEMWEPSANGLFKPAAYFLQKLAELKQANPAVKIELIGHSAGSIVIAHFLAAAEKRHQLTFNNVIFLAPAATMDLFYKEVVDKPDRYVRFVMFTMNDERERADNINYEGIPLYNRSLLYLVAGILETEVDQPLSGMVRYMTGKAPFDSERLKQITDFLNQNERLVLAGEPQSGDLKTNATTHGGYYAEKETVDSIKKLFGLPLTEEVKIKENTSKGIKNMSTFHQGYALLIGVNQNLQPHYALPAVKKDVDNLANILVNPDFCGYPEDNIKVLLGENATRANILAGLDWLKNSLKTAGDDQTALIYFSGHGHIVKDAFSNDGEEFLIPYDLDGTVSGSALDSKTFARAIHGIDPKRLLVMLDCCHAWAMNVKGASPFGENSKALSPESRTFAPLFQGEGRAIFSSSAGEEQSYIRSDGTMSIFTYYLIEALTGKAQKEGTTKVLVSDLMGHIQREVKAFSVAEGHKPQNPQFRLVGENFPIALVAGGKGYASKGLIPDPVATAEKVAGSASQKIYTIGNVGAGAVVAQGDGATAVGAGGVSVGGSNTGNIITGNSNTVNETQQRPQG